MKHCSVALEARDEEAGTVFREKARENKEN
jgi:hypothetical protein